MTEKIKRFQFNLRISEKKKKKWREFLALSDFTDLTKLIKYCVDGYIDGLLIERHKIESTMDNTQREKQLDKIITLLTDERETLISQLSSMKKKGLEEEEVLNTQKIKNQILTYLGDIKRATNDKISEIIGVELPRTQKILNILEFKQELIRMNSDSTYELVEEEI